MAGPVAFLALVPLQWLAAQAPEDGRDEAVMYSKGHFKGVSRTVLGPTRFNQPFMMKSVAIPAGTQWEFCSGNTYTGCRQISQSVPAMVMNVRSARPVANIIPASATPVEQGLRGSGQSLRGLATEFFVAPDAGGNRTEVQGGTAEAMSRAAIDFCRSRGWRMSAHQRMQSIGGKFYLADVLCANE
jgi:hypothetical protein